MINNFLTFDIEEWNYGNFLNTNLKKIHSSKFDLEVNINNIIKICSKYNIKSTCFVVGELGKKYPDIVKRLDNEGHEIASHSNSHNLIYSMTPEEFNKDLKKSCSILEDIIGKKVVGFRAPSWSVNKDIVDWFYDVLYENGIKYSSSIFPSQMYLYGLPDFPEKIHYPVIDSKKKKVIEIPQVLVNILGKKIGFSGGFYLRVLPAWFIIKNIKKKNREGKNIFIYLHPHELGGIKSKVDLGIKEQIILKYGVKTCEKKLDKILKIFQNTFITIRDFLSIAKY